MLTRNQSRKLEPNIDFDEASKAWNANKRKMENGCYVYICGAPMNDGKPCQNILSKCRKHISK